MHAKETKNDQIREEQNRNKRRRKKFPLWVCSIDSCV